MQLVPDGVGQHETDEHAGLGGDGDVHRVMMHDDSRGALIGMFDERLAHAGRKQFPQMRVPADKPFDHPLGDAFRKMPADAHQAYRHREAVII